MNCPICTDTGSIVLRAPGVVERYTACTCPAGVPVRRELAARKRRAPRVDAFSREIERFAARIRARGGVSL